MNHFHYDPFPALGGREHCTVGTLRESAAGHDVSIRSVRPDTVGHHTTGIEAMNAVPDYA